MKFCKSVIKRLPYSIATFRISYPAIPDGLSAQPKSPQFIEHKDVIRMVDEEVSGHKIALGESTDIPFKNWDAVSFLAIREADVTGEIAFLEP